RLCPLEERRDRGQAPDRIRAVAWLERERSRGLTARDGRRGLGGSFLADRVGLEAALLLDDAPQQVAAILDGLAHVEHARGGPAEALADRLLQPIALLQGLVGIRVQRLLEPAPS